MGEDASGTWQTEASPGPPGSAAPTPGTSLGSYRLLDVLGEGGMGTVYRAEHSQLGRQVAIKVLHPDLARNGESLARFFREARAVNTIRHPNIVDVTDLIELEGGTAFIVMELLQGSSLREQTRGERPPTWWMVEVARQICDALGAAHARGIIHRDLTPRNVFVLAGDDARPRIKLLDFGIAKLTGESEDGTPLLKTADGAILGTPGYMAPEQARGEAIDARADIYALGVILYELASGARPFAAQSGAELLERQGYTDPVPVLSTRGGATLDLEVAALIMRCLSREPGERPADASELGAELARLAERFPPPGLAARRFGLIHGIGLGLLLALGAAVAAFAGC